MLRALPGQYRALVGGEDRHLRVCRHQRGSWSAVECVTHLTEVLQRADTLLSLVMFSEGRVLLTPVIEAPRASANTVEWQAALIGLGGAAEHLACTIENVPPQGWRAVGEHDERVVCATELAWAAVHDGSRHLEDARGAMAEFNGAQNALAR